MTILWCAEFLGDYEYPYPSSSGTIAYNIISRLLDRKINVSVADPRSGRHRSFVTESGKAIGRLYATYNHRDILDVVSRLKPEKVVTDELQIATMLLSIPDCPEIVLIARGHELPVIEAGSFTLVSVSMAMKNALNESGIDSTYIPPGVDRDLYKKIQRPKKGFIFGCACRNKNEKNLPTLMEAYRLFNENFMDAAALAIHTDNGVWDVRRMAKQLGIQNNVFFGNWPVDQASMNRIYNTFDVHINVGGAEWSALPVLESMAIGIPQIVSDYGVLTEYAKGCGILVPVKTMRVPPCGNIRVPEPEDISSAMEKMWINEIERTAAGTAALERAGTYSWERSAKLWGELLLK